MIGIINILLVLQQSKQLQQQKLKQLLETTDKKVMQLLDRMDRPSTVMPTTGVLQNLTIILYQQVVTLGMVAKAQ